MGKGCETGMLTEVVVISYEGGLSKAGLTCRMWLGRPTVGPRWTWSQPWSCGIFRGLVCLLPHGQGAFVQGLAEERPFCH